MCGDLRSKVKVIMSKNLIFRDFRVKVKSHWVMVKGNGHRVRVKYHAFSSYMCVSTI